MSSPDAALIVANGSLTDGPLLRETLAALSGAMVIAADGGARLARDCGLRVDVLIGDMDSIEPRELARLQAEGAQVLRHPVDKDETDLELALKWVAAQGIGCFRILGALGDRIDQTLANVALLALPQLLNCDAQLIDGKQRAWLLRPGEHEICGAAGDTLSLLPLQGPAQGIVSQGLRWELRDETLRPGPARGISNRLEAADASLRFSGGLLLVVHTRGRA